MNEGTSPDGKDRIEDAIADLEVASEMLFDADEDTFGIGVAQRSIDHAMFTLMEERDARDEDDDGSPGSYLPADSIPVESEDDER